MRREPGIGASGGGGGSGGAGSCSYVSAYVSSFSSVGGSYRIPGNTSDADYAGNAGYGGMSASSGNGGRIVLSW